MPQNNSKVDARQVLDQKLDQLISEYGKELVQERSLSKLSSKRGRRPINDKPEILEQVFIDARCWLDGGDPTSVISNYKVASAIAKRRPQPSIDSARRRILRKLKKDRSTLFVAKAIAQAVEEKPLPELQTLIQRALAENTAFQKIYSVLAIQCDELERRFRDRFEIDVGNLRLKSVSDILSISGSKNGGLGTTITLEQAIELTDKRSKI